MIEINAVLKNIKEWVRIVGEYQLSKLQQKIQSHSKSTDIDMVTEVDVMSEKMLLDRIKELYPEHDILCEETGMHCNQSEYTWIIDPLDGTNNYYHSYPIFSISIALRYKSDTILGVVYVPKLNEMFYAIKDEGAYLNNQKIAVSETQSLQYSLLATGFPYDKAIDRDNNNLVVFNSIVPDIMGIRRSGSAAFDLCCVACGRLDGYWELKLKQWDVAAGDLIIREAGGETLICSHEKGINVIAGSKAIFQEIRQKIDECYTIFYAGERL